MNILYLGYLFILKVRVSGTSLDRQVWSCGVKWGLELERWECTVQRCCLMSWVCKGTPRERVRTETLTRNRAIGQSALEAEKREKQKMQPERQEESKDGRGLGSQANTCFRKEEVIHSATCC